MSGGINGLLDNVLNKWMFDYQYEPSSTANYTIAHVSPNGGCVCNDEGGQIFYGDVTGTSRLVEIPIPSGRNATGGVVVIHPYLVYFGSDGIIGWSVEGTPTDLVGSGSGVARPWSQKIVKGFPLRSGSSGPAAIFWAYDAVIRMSFTGGATVFQFDVIATETSIMGPDSVISFDGIYYWAGVDRFMMFNGVVREVDNQMNLNYFFDNLNASQRSKVFAAKVPKFGEIWWYYPRGDATECTHAIIYNVREGVWYDTELPNTGRSAGQFNNGFASPILTGVVESGDGYKVWIHEQGVDEVDGITTSPIKSYFTTSYLTLIDQGLNNLMSINSIEPDFVQIGQMEIQISGKANARAPLVTSSVVIFPESASRPFEQVVNVKELRRELKVTFTSNTVGGNYQMGKVIAHIEPDQGTNL